MRPGIRRAGDAVLVAALVVCACGPGEGGSEPGSEPGSETGYEGGASGADSASAPGDERGPPPETDSARAADPANADGAVCLRGGPFVANGAMDVTGDGTSGAAGGAGAGGSTGTSGAAGAGGSAGTSGAAGAGGTASSTGTAANPGAPGTSTTPPDADRVAALRWNAHEGCERFVVDLLDADGDAADRTGEVTAEVIRELGVVRVALRDVEWVESEATDARLGGPLARAAYAVFSPDGHHVFVDVHLGEPAEARVTTLQDPARVVVDLRPGGPPLPAPAHMPAARGDRVVVLSPRPGPASYPLTVVGYARTFEANVVLRLERGGEDVHEDFTTATAWVDAWGHYAFVVPEGPSGPVVLHVGGHSARDGTWEGVAVPLEMR